MTEQTTTNAAVDAAAEAATATSVAATEAGAQAAAEIAAAEAASTTVTAAVEKPAEEAATEAATEAADTAAAATAAADGATEIDQATKDKAYGAVRREFKEKLEAKDRRIAELEAKEHDYLLDSLSVEGVKRERLEKTGLKGDALAAFAAELAADIAEARGAAAPAAATTTAAAAAAGFKLEDALSATAPNGVAFSVGKELTMDEMMEQLKNEIGGAN